MSEASLYFERIAALEFEKESERFLKSWLRAFEYEILLPFERSQDAAKFYGWLEPWGA